MFPPQGLSGLHPKRFWLSSKAKMSWRKMGRFSGKNFEL
jgi:hypothetical protein